MNNSNLIDVVWNQAEIVPGFNKNIWRKDFAGAWIKRNLYDKNVDLGWNVVSLCPKGYGNYIAVNVKNVDRINVDGDIFTTLISSHNNTNIKKVQSWRVEARWKGRQGLKYQCVPIKPEKNGAYHFESKIVLWSLVSILVIAVGVYLFYCSNSFFNYFTPFDPVVWGTFGDSVFAIIACIMAYLNVLLLYNTFKLQLESNKSIQEANATAERNVLYNKLDTTFKTLMEMYIQKRQQEKTIHFDVFNKIMLQDIPSYADRHQLVMKKYQLFYSKYRTMLSDYYRLVYRIFETIDRAETDDEDKVQYMKIFRSQLNDEELLLLHYNCYTNEGYNMGRYVNKYNILKHLPFMSRFELTDNPFGESFILEVNDFLRIFQDKLIDSVLKYDKQITDDKRSKIPITFRCKTDSLEPSFEIEVSIIDSKTINVFVFTNLHYRRDILKKLEKFLKQYFIELFIFSTFELFQKYTELQVHSSFEINATQTLIIFYIKKTSENPIILSYNQLRVPCQANELRNN